MKQGVFEVVNWIISLISSWILSWIVPKDPNLLLVSGRQYGGNTKPILLEAEKFGLHSVWITNRPDVLKLNNKKIISAYSLKGLWYGARASKVVFTHTVGDFKPLTFPSSRVAYYNVWHGMPMRKISTMDPDFWKRKHAKSNVREMKRYTGMFVSSFAMRDIFQKTFGLDIDKIHITGQPRTDDLVKGKFVCFDSLYDPPLPHGHKKILYCPTWREGEPVKLFPFPDRNIEKLQSVLEEMNAVIYVRTHPNDPGRWFERDKRIVPFQGDVVSEVTDALGRFDVLITDYSSVFYDFLLLNRPTIFFSYDLDEYSQSPGFYISYKEFAAGPHPETQQDFVSDLKSSLTKANNFAVERKKIHDKMYGFSDDLATERVLSIIKNDIL